MIGLPPRRGTTAIVLIALWVADARATSIVDVLSQPPYGARFRPVASAMAQAIGRSLPAIAASPGIHYAYDYASNSYVRQVALGGELFVERADPVGRGRSDLSLFYQHVRFDQVGGKSLGDLSDTRPIVNARGDPLLSIDGVDLNVEVHEAVFNAIYGVSDRLDVSVMVPLIASSLDRREHLTFFNDGSGTPVSGHVAVDSTGIGDVLLRAKGYAVEGRGFNAGAGLSLRLPSGSLDDLHGVGTTEVTPGLFVSSREHGLGHGIGMRGDLNLAMLLDTGDVARSEGRWAVAGTLGFAGRAALGIGLLGRDLVSPIFPERTGGYLRCAPTVDHCVTFVKAPLFGFQGGRPDYLDLSVGGRILLWRDTLIGFVNVLLPLLDQGLIAAPTPVVGIELSL